MTWRTGRCSEDRPTSVSVEREALVRPTEIGNPGPAGTATDDQGPSAPAAGAAPGGRGAGRAGARAAAGWAQVVAAAAGMAGLGVWGLARGSAMGNDEVASRWAARLSLSQLARLVRHVDAVHGLYYLLLHGWTAIGTSPALLRVPSVAAMVAAAALLVVLGRRLTGSGWA